MNYTLFLSNFTITILLSLYSNISIAQTNVTRIYTDHNGFFTSATGSPVTVDVATHHLIAFQTGGTVWSTGVNDAVLTSNAVTFTPQVFQAMPATVIGTNSSALIGIGRQFGGYTGSNGCVPAVAPPQGSNLSAYLTDGINGLDLSTAVFNIGGNVNYTVANIDGLAIGDGIPDIIITQAGDVNGSLLDQFRFLDVSNNIVGSQVGVNFNTVSTVARPTWKFYTTPGLVCGASTAATRDLRVLTFDFADLGITALNYTNVTKFQHQLTPNSDVAFVAYNQQSIEILPIELLSFTAKEVKDKVLLNWETATEINNDYFTVERSKDVKNWEKVFNKPGAGSSNSLISYDAIDESPLSEISYYRLKQTDFDGKTSYSNIAVVNFENTSFNVYPNPTDKLLNIDININDNNEPVSLIIKDVTGKTVIEQTLENSNKIDVSFLAKGFYHVQLSNNTIKHNQKIVIQ